MLQPRSAPAGSKCWKRTEAAAGSRFSPACGNLSFFRIYRRRGGWSFRFFIALHSKAIKTTHGLCICIRPKQIARVDSGAEFPQFPANGTSGSRRPPCNIHKLASPSGFRLTFASEKCYNIRERNARRHRSRCGRLYPYRSPCLFHRGLNAQKDANSNAAFLLLFPGRIRILSCCDRLKGRMYRGDTIYSPSVKRKTKTSFPAAGRLGKSPQNSESGRMP